MRYRIRIEPKAKKGLKKIPKKYQKKILAALPILEENPHIGKKLSGKFRDAYSYYVWPYRIVYKIYRNLLLVVVIKVGYRQGVYK